MIVSRTLWLVKWNLSAKLRFGWQLRGWFDNWSTFQIIPAYVLSSRNRHVYRGRFFVWKLRFLIAASRISVSWNKFSCRFSLSCFFLLAVTEKETHLQLRIYFRRWDLHSLCCALEAGLGNYRPQKPGHVAGLRQGGFDWSIRVRPSVRGPQSRFRPERAAN